MSGRGFGRGRGGGRQGFGGPSYCVCPKCGYKAPHVRGTPYLSTKCPKMRNGYYAIILIPLRQ